MGSRVRETDSKQKARFLKEGTEMKIQIIKAEGNSLNHNQGGLKVKPQLVAGAGINHNQGGLKIR